MGTTRILATKQTALLLVLFTVAAVRQVSARSATASAELGQPGFTTSTCDNPLLTSPQQLCHPAGVAVDNHSGLLFVADGDNNRILIWPSATKFRNGEPASAVLGQPSFAIGGKCTGGTTASTICDPNGLAVDTLGHLFVSDTDGDRILRFSPPFSNGMAADMVIGQRSFTTSICGVDASTLCHPRGVALDASGNLFVADSNNNRVLVFEAPLTSGESASLLIGQAAFNDKHCNRSGSPGPQTLCGPRGVILDPAGNLYVAEDDNSRVLEFNDPLHSPTTDISASRVFGQPDFSASTCGVGPTSLCNPDDVALGTSGQLIISDKGNNRLLVFDSPLANTVANQVIGQPDFFSNTAATTASGLASPKGLAVDRAGNLYVTDEDNNRVLRFDRAE